MRWSSFSVSGIIGTVGFERLVMESEDGRLRETPEIPINLSSCPLPLCWRRSSSL
ncbi:hypothetical protein [Crocosphaera subtropica]|uniref:hypothetical protein n=1 Tax=Crocosphaera subtropica TaxID=2546360 RepID=UPI0012EB16F6|nr:hypothetical protein [Crocosphaera subtropica]